MTRCKYLFKPILTLITSHCTRCLLSLSFPRSRTESVQINLRPLLHVVIHSIEKALLNHRLTRGSIFREGAVRPLTRPAPQPHRQRGPVPNRGDKLSFFETFSIFNNELFRDSLRNFFGWVHLTVEPRNNIQ
jgi:hypothetical protein